MHSRPTLRCVIVAGLLGAACAEPATERAPLTSSTLAISEDGTHLFAVSTDDGMLTSVELASSAVTRVAAGREPIRVARARGRVFVTLRAERAVAVFEDVAGSLELQRKVDVGAEPFGVVASHDGARVYVASSLSGRVDELDVETLEILRSWELTGEPRWLAIHPEGRRLYVGSAFGEAWSWIDLENGQRHGGLLPSVFQQQVLSTSAGFEIVDVKLAARITGDPAISADGSRIYWPALYANTTTALAEFTETATASDTLGTAGYQNRFNPVLVAVPLDVDGEPLWMRGVAMPVSTSAFAGLPNAGIRVASSYPSAAALADDERFAIVAIEGSTAVSIITLLDPATDGALGGLTAGTPTGSAGASGSSGSLSIPAQRPGIVGSFGVGAGVVTFAVRTDAGPRGLVVEGGRAWIDTFLARSVSALRLQPIEALLTTTDPQTLAMTTRSVEVERPIEITPPVLDEATELGRRLFYTANDGRVSGVTSGVSCATCHMDGRNDGLSWTFTERGARQTPSLAGPVHLTEPLGWEGAVPTLLDEVMRTSTQRMGGVFLTAEDGENIAAYLRRARDVDVPERGATTPQVERGRALFERSDVGCARCHSGARLTDNQNHAVLDFEPTKTRSLVGIAASPPYLHDGSAKTLRDVLLRARDGTKGDTSALSEEDLTDLEAYLKSL